MISQKREVSNWIFALELRDSKVTEKNEEWANAKPIVITPLGTRVRRVLINGIISQKSVQDEMAKLTISDGTGNFYLSAFNNDFNRPGKDELNEFQINDSVLVMGRLNSFGNEDKIYFSISPELIQKSDDILQKFWSSRARYIAIRKIYAIREAGKDPESSRESLMNQGYSLYEADCALRSLKNYPDYDIQNFERVIASSPAPEKKDDEELRMKEAIINYIKQNDDNGKGCRYEDISAASKLLGFEENKVDEILNQLGSDGEIYEASLKRYRVI